MTRPTHIPLTTQLRDTLYRWGAAQAQRWRYLRRRVRSLLRNQLYLSWLQYVGPRKDPHAPPRMLLISGEPHASGHTYRVRHMAEGLRQLGWEVVVLPVWELRWRLYLLWNTRWVHLWRADVRSFGQDWARFLRTLQRWDIRFSYDLDDYLFDPHLATPAQMDWMRLADAPEAYVQGYARHQRQPP